MRHLPNVVWCCMFIQHWCIGLMIIQFYLISDFRGGKHTAILANDHPMLQRSSTARPLKVGNYTCTIGIGPFWYRIIPSLTVFFQVSPRLGGREGTNWGNQPWGGTNWGTRKSGDHSIIMLFDMFVSMEIFEITSFGLRLQSSVGLWFSLEQVGSDSRRLIPSSSSATVKTSHGSKETPDNPTSLRCKNFETICNHCFLLL